MCGIIAVFSKNGSLDIDRCDQALNKLNKRGPDFSFRNMYLNNRLYLGQTVLSITGDPYNIINKYHLSQTGRFDILFNGEIYNYRTLYTSILKSQGYINKSNTDTEVLVNLHDIYTPSEVFIKLEGMFAYILYDQFERNIYFGRDIIGEKIIYSYENDDLLIISSEIGPILEICPSIKINKDVLREYFFTRHLLTTFKSPFIGVNLLTPGTLLKFNVNSYSSQIICERKPADFIIPDLVESNKTRSSDDLVDELEAIFQETAEKLVPESINYYSVFSGGIDSSIVSYFVNKKRPATGYISLKFPEKDKVNEDLINFERILGKQIENISISIEMFKSFFPDCYLAACSPLATHSFVSQAILSKYVRDHKTKVIIGGDGADELFGGYEFYKKLAVFDTIQEYNPSPYSGFVDLGVTFDSWDSFNLKNELRENWKTFNTYFDFEKNPTEKLIQTVLYSDTVIQLESVGIRSADTMSMLHSVEPRSFYLSQNMIKFALNLPAQHKIDFKAGDDIMITKPLLKKLFIRYFGKDLLFPKQGFSGYPNEAGRELVSDFGSVKKYLNLNSMNNLNSSLEWKLLNVELFLQFFKQYQ